MAKIMVSASSLPAGRNMSSQTEYIKRVQNYGAEMYHLDVMDGLFVSQQTIDYTYGIENLNNLDDKYYDGKLKYLQNQMNYYYNILSGNYDGDYDFVNLSLNNLDGIIEYYKNSLLEEISEANQDESNDFNNISLIIENYSNFLNIYNSYLLGTITTLTDFKKALGDNLLLLKTINSLINEKIILEEYAKKQYLKYLDEYTIRIDQLLKIYKDKESGVE